MNQQDYMKIAEVIDKCYAPTTEAEQTKKNIASGLADYFEKTGINNNVGNFFDSVQFLKLCGVSE